MGKVAICLQYGWPHVIVLKYQYLFHIIIIIIIIIVVVSFVSTYINDQQTLQLFKVLGSVKNFSEEKRFQMSSMWTDDKCALEGGSKQWNLYTQRPTHQTSKVYAA